MPVCFSRISLPPRVFYRTSSSGAFAGSPSLGEGPSVVLPLVQLPAGPPLKGADPSRAGLRWGPPDMYQIPVAPARVFLLEGCQDRERDWLGETASSWQQGWSLHFLRSGLGVSHHGEQRRASLREGGLPAPPPWTICGCRVTGTLPIHRAIRQLSLLALFVCWLRKGDQCFPLP